MKNIIYISIVFLLYSCSALKIQQSDIIGEFYKREVSKNTLSVSYNLLLKSDSIFTLSMKMQDANPKCNGKWTLKDNYIYLKCDETQDVGDVLSSGYMNEREYKLEVLNSNKIKFKNSILKRK